MVMWVLVRISSSQAVYDPPLHLLYWELGSLHGNGVAELRPTESIETDFSFSSLMEGGRFDGSGDRT